MKKHLRTARQEMRKAGRRGMPASCLGGCVKASGGFHQCCQGTAMGSCTEWGGRAEEMECAEGVEWWKAKY